MFKNLIVNGYFSFVKRLLDETSFYANILMMYIFNTL